MCHNDHIFTASISLLFNFYLQKTSVTVTNQQRACIGANEGHHRARVENGCHPAVMVQGDHLAVAGTRDGRAR